MRKTLLGRVPEASPIYALHPVTRFVLLLATGFAPIFIDLPEANLLFLAAILLAMVWAGVDLSRLKIYTPLLVTLFLFMFLVVLIFPGQDAAYTHIRLGPVGTFYQPIFWAFVSYCRILALLFASIFYFSTNLERDTLVALRTLRVPFAATYVAALSIRAAGMFMEDFAVVRQAERARGLDTASMSLRDKGKLYVMYMVPLFTLALRRAEEIGAALFARGYNVLGRVASGGRRADYLVSRFPVRPADYLGMALLATAFASIVYLQLVESAFRIHNSPLNRFFLERLAG